MARAWHGSLGKVLNLQSLISTYLLSIDLGMAVPCKEIITRRSGDAEEGGERE